MTRKARFLTAFLASALLLGSTSGASPALTERQRALHVLNRLGFGPRPGDVDRVLAMGVDRYIEQQLHPQRIDDRALETRLAKYETLKLSDQELMTQLYQPFIEARQQRRLGDAETQGRGEETGRGDAATRRRGDAEMRGERNGMRRVLYELSAARIDRALESNRQLNEVMADFWMNHFNVFAGKGLDRVLIVSYERDTIRPNMWGKFEDLLMATAKSPAMLFYLDNARSIATPENRPALRRGDAATRRRGGAMRQTEAPRRSLAASPRLMQGGLNENYARELLELHTLGVDGGYTQKDVTELARLLTGWSIARPNEGRSGFVFRAPLHDTKSKTILGKQFPAGGGLSEGEEMIRYLAHHPSTAKFIATKLCQRLVADEPPPQLVNRVAKRFLDTGGDLRETVEAVITSPEFFDPRYYRIKVKTPFEYVMSAVRAVGGSSENPLAIVQALRNMGQPLYFAQPPTGYDDAAEAWVNTGALMNRINFALALAASKLPGVSVKIEASSVEGLASRIVGGDLTAETRRTIQERLDQEPIANTTADQKTTLITGLILGSPEFQRQ